MIRGIVTAVVEGVIKRFSCSGRVDETIDDREYFQHYGFTSRPTAGAEVIIVREGNHFVAVASDDRRYRIAIANGEAALYDDLGQTVHLTRTGIRIVSPLGVTIDTPLTTMTGDLHVDGDISDGIRTMAGDRTIYNGHHHSTSPVPTEQM